MIFPLLTQNPVNIFILYVIISLCYSIYKNITILHISQILIPLLINIILVVITVIYFIIEINTKGFVEYYYENAKLQQTVIMNITTVQDISNIIIPLSYDYLVTSLGLTVLFIFNWMN